MQNHKQYDAIEIHGVAELGHGVCEVDDDHPDFYSVYLHLIPGCVDCHSDHDTHEAAQKTANIIAKHCNLPIYDFVTA